MKKYAINIAYKSYCCSFLYLLLLFSCTFSSLSATHRPGDDVSESLFTKLPMEVGTQIMRQCDGHTRKTLRSLCHLFYTWTWATARVCSFKKPLPQESAASVCKKCEFSSPEDLEKVIENIGKMGSSLITLTFLRCLTNQHCQKISSLAVAGSLKALRELHMWGCSHVTDEGFGYLASLASLNWLNLARSQITNVGLAYLTGRKQMRDDWLPSMLRFSSPLFSSLPWWSQFMERDIKSLKQPVSLTWLSLSWCDWITDKGLMFLTTLSSLTQLDLKNCDGITGGTFAFLRQLSFLTHLDLAHCYGITDEGPRALGAHPSLKNLVFWKCAKITDAGLEHLASLSSLIDLDFNECKQITDKGLASLTSLSSLT